MRAGQYGFENDTFHRLPSMFGRLTALLREFPATPAQKFHLLAEVAATPAHHQVKVQAHFLHHAKFLVHPLRHQRRRLFTIQHPGSPN